MSDNIQQTIINLLNQASIYGKDNIRVQNLRHVQELILRKHPDLFEIFLEDILTFQTDKSIEIKKTIISFIEEACQNNPKVIIKLIDNLHFFLYDENIFLQKKFILSLNSIYKSTLLWLSKSNNENIDHIWKCMINMKNSIISQLDSKNDQLYLVVIKFLEMFIINLSEYQRDILENNQNILFQIQFEQEEKDMMEKLFQLILSQHLSDTYLIATIEAIMNIIRYKPDYLNRILEIFELLQNNLSSNLIDSQISNVRKIIQIKLFNLLKHSVSSELQPRIQNLLINLGATQSEILKSLPKTFSESKRKLTSTNHNKNPPKKSKHINEDLNKSDLLSPSENQTVTNLIEKLTLKNVVDLVIESMKFLPEKIPPSFQSIYTPVADAGSPFQIEYLARLLNTQLTASGHEFTNKTDVKCDDLLPSITSNANNKISLRLTNEISSKKSKLLKSIKPIEYNEMQRMSIDSFYRILHAEDICDKAGSNPTHKRILNSLVSLFSSSFCHIYKDYIMNNISQRYDLIFSWIYSEYVYANGYLTNQKKDFTKYDDILCEILEYLQEKDHDLFSRLLINVPLITDNALSILKRYCQDERKTNFGLNILNTLLIHRIPIQEKCLDILFDLIQFENNSIRTDTLNIAKNLSKKNQSKQLVEMYALKVLQTLKFDFDSGIIEDYFLFYVSLIPSNHSLIQPLADIYITMNEDIKQIIISYLNIPIREMGMNSPDLLKLIKNCPKGAETLIIQIIHILTEQTSPSYEFIRNIRDLYHQHISDIRFLIPILTSLEKSEILNLLPKLLILSPSVVKEVFNKLLDLNVSTKTSPISPSELLISLHKISLEECQLKTVINATSLCFNEHSIYTDNILAKIIQDLIEITPIPLLFMRTVLQTLNLFPKMIDFIINILQQLIEKQVWKQTRIWDGFIKCCEKTGPYSYPILLQLPPLQLKQIFERTSELHVSLRHHLHSLSLAQLSTIPSSILTIIEDK